MPNQKKTSVWNHFVEAYEGKKIIGKCKYCGQTYANNATRMKRHLCTCKKCPERIQCNFQKLKQHTGVTTCGKNLLQKSQETEESEVDLPVDLDKTEATSSRYSKPQNILSRFVDKMSKEDQEKTDETLARAIFASGTPLSITENKYWVEHYKHIRPSYKLPSRYRLSHSLLDREYDRVQETVVQKIAEAESLTLLSDGWTDIQGNPLINIMFATPEPIFLKAVNTKCSRHTGEYIAEILGAEIEKVGPSKVLALVTDNASNMKAAWQILQENYPHLIIFGCLAHGLNLLAKDILSLNSIRTVLLKCKAIVKLFKNHHVANQTLKAIQKEKQGKNSSLFLPAETRWGSATKCFESLLRTKNCLQCAAIDDTISQIMPQNVRKQILDNDIFWVQVQTAHNLLLPISVAIKKLEGDTPAISEVTVIFKKLNAEIIDQLPSSPLTKEEKSVKLVLNNRYNFCFHSVHLAANLLDPRYCGQNLSEDDLMTAIDAVIEVAKHTPDINEVTVMSDIAEYRAKEKLWCKDIIWKAASNISPTTWWKGYCNTRELSRVAVRILNIPPTAASCERNWKAFSTIKTKKRNRLTNERTAKLVSVSQNLHLINDDIVVPSNSEQDLSNLEDSIESSHSSSSSDLDHPMLSDSESEPQSLDIIESGGFHN